MERLQRISWALLLVGAACGDDVPSGSDGSTGGDESSTGETVDPTNVTTTTINPTGSSSSSSSTDADTTGEPETSSTTDEETTTSGPTTSDTEDTDSTTSTTTDDTTGDPLDCGNDMIDGREACDGTELDDATCVSLGFASGDLTCAADCTFDTAACDSCGNAVVDAGEDCDGVELDGATCQSLGMGFTGGVLACDAVCGFDMAGCTSVPYPAVGEVILSEIMPDPTVALDADGEWFELHNPSTTETYQLSGCELSGQVGEEVIVIAGDFQIGPDAYLTFAPDSEADAGFTPSYEYTENFFVANNGDLITLTCDGTVIDTVDYDAFPPGAGVSLNLDPDFFDSVSNDAAENWCPGVSVYFAPDTGTPGAANDECVAPTTYPIDFCRMQFPDAIAQDTGTSIDVFGRVFSTGLTDISTSNDLAPEVSAQLGYGPDGTDPAVDAGWTWIDAAPNAGYTAVEEPDNDEYQASLTVPAPGEYDYAYRFSGDSELTYTYCDGMAEGSSDGYTAANAGQMTSNLVSGEFDLYFSEYVEGSGNSKALEIVNVGDADADLSACEIVNYSNGSATPSFNFVLSGTVTAGDVFVTCDSGSGAGLLAVCDLPTNDNALGFNGDDALVLTCNGVTLDVIGLIGEDPGSFWPRPEVNDSPTADTQDETIRRNCDAVPDIDGTDDFDPSTDWTSFPQDSFDDLGQYICD